MRSDFPFSEILPQLQYVLYLGILRDCPLPNVSDLSAFSPARQYVPQEHGIFLLYLPEYHYTWLSVSIDCNWLTGEFD